MLQQRSRLSPLERREKQKVLLRDTVALCTLAALVVVLSFLTYALFHSFSTHQQMLEARWRARGEAALAAGKPLLALNDLRSALAYAPDNRQLQVELATALAASGQTQEAQVYFTTLLEGEPGSGLINLQLARLAIRQGNARGAIDYYEAAIDGTWQGDAFTRRRDIRLELARFLIAQGHFPEARGLLLITSGNGPDNHPLQVMLGALLEQANDPADALDVYRKAATQRGTRLQAMEGEAHAAASLGRFAEARSYLAQAVADPGFARQPQAVRDEVHAELGAADGVLALYPANTLPPAQRAIRIVRAAKLAQARLLACPVAPAPTEAAAAGGSPAPPVPGPQRARLLAALGTHLQQLTMLGHHGAATNTADSAVAATAPPAAAGAAAEPGTPADPLAALAAQWTALATGAALQRQLTTDPIFAQGTLQLVYETERAAAAACGAPTGDDALLLKIAQAPDQVEVQP